MTTATRTEEALNPWDRRPAETPRAYQMFCVYKDMGPRRSIRVLAAREPMAHVAQLFKWSRTYDWVDRAGSWDDFLLREEQKDQLEAAKAMRRRHAELGRSLLDTCIEAARQVNTEKLAANPRDLATLTDLAVKLERQARTEALGSIVIDPDTGQIEGPTGADILAALKDNPVLSELAEELDRVMLGDD
jgi:hypothetical protein